jgi:adenylate cyclase
MEQIALPGLETVAAGERLPARLPGQLLDLEWLTRLFAVRPRRDRRVTIMFTDVAGFTGYAGRRGDRAAARLLRRADHAVLPAVRHHGGRIVKRLGDGLMIVFPAPADAVAAALAIQHAAARRARLALRIGVHTGEARTRDGDLIGHDVNVASRITDRAGGGETLVSGTVHAAGGCAGARFRRVRALVVPGRAALAVYRVEEEKPWS